MATPMASYISLENWPKQSCKYTRIYKVEQKKDIQGILATDLEESVQPFVLLLYFCSFCLYDKKIITCWLKD